MTTSELTDTLKREGLPIHKDRIQRAINGGFVDPPPEKNEKGHLVFQPEHVGQLRTYLTTVRRGRPSKKRDGDGVDRKPPVISQPRKETMTMTTTATHENDVAEDLPLAFSDSGPRPSAGSVRERIHADLQRVWTGTNNGKPSRYQEIGAETLAAFAEACELIVQHHREFPSIDSHFLREFITASGFAFGNRLNLQSGADWGRLLSSQGRLTRCIQYSESLLEIPEEPATRYEDEASAAPAVSPDALRNCTAPGAGMGLVGFGREQAEVQRRSEPEPLDFHAAAVISRDLRRILSST